jgi:GNAT superfamily N-acetyltransferase
MPHRYPQEAVLRDGRRVLLRPFAEKDVDALFEFFQHLPVAYRRFAWDPIENRSLIESWGRDIATLHRRHGGPLRLTGRLKWMIDPVFRGVGLGTLLVNQFIGIAREKGLRHINAMLISDLEADAVTTLQNLGFTSYVMPGYGTDPDGNQHDMTKLILKL